MVKALIIFSETCSWGKCTSKKLRRKEEKARCRSYERRKTEKRERGAKASPLTFNKVIHLRRANGKSIMAVHLLEYLSRVVLVIVVPLYLCHSLPTFLPLSSPSFFPFLMFRRVFVFNLGTVLYRRINFLPETILRKIEKIDR